MRHLFALLLLALSSTGSFAQMVTVTPRGPVVAHDGRIELFSRNGASVVWSAEGVRTAGAIASDAARVAVVDPIENVAVIASLADGTARRIETGETPVAALFSGGELWLLARDARLLQSASGQRVELAADPAFLRAGPAGRLFVYSRSGVLQEIEGGRVRRSLPLPAGGADLEISGATAYIAWPRAARIRAVDLETMTVSGELTVGAVPVDFDFAGGGTALTAPILAVADPSSKRVWMTEATQSSWQAFGRAFLRSFIGMGLFTGRSDEFPTGVDRVTTAGSAWAAYDSASGSLYRFTRRQRTLLATGVAPGAFAVAADEVVWWDGSRLRVSR